MVNDVLLRFLRNHLLDVGSDDTKFDRLQTAADELAQGLSASPAKAIAYSLIAADPQAPATDPTVTEVMAVLESKWRTYSNTFAATPVGIVRALLLSALAKVSSDDNAIGVALVSLARNVLPQMEVGAESSIWTDVVAEIEKFVDSRAERDWATPSSISIGHLALPDIPATPVTAKPAAIDADGLNAKILAATGPFGSGEQNQYQPNQGQPWAAEFAKRLAQAIAETVGAVVAPLGGKPVDIAPILKTVTAGVGSYVEKALVEVSVATAGLQRRTNLLWWKESVYSASALRSYRGLPDFTAAALMAYDLHLQVPTFSPASVAALLNEAVEALCPSTASAERPIRELVAEAKTAAALAEFRKTAARLAPFADARCLVVSVVGSVAAIGSDDEFVRLLGVSPDTKLTASQWAIWIFRELQAVRAITESAGTTAKKSQG